MTRSQLRWLLRGASMLLACAMAWSSRFSLDPDGMSYVDLARYYVRGDWHNALSSYWSPLYPWLLAIFFGLLRPTPEWLIPLTHAVCLMLFVGVLAAWEWLIGEWEISHGPPAHWPLIDTAGYLLITWTGLELGGVDFSSADDAVIALLIASVALIVRIRRAPQHLSNFLWLGVVLAFGFFAKTAFQTIVPAVFVILFASRARLAQVVYTSLTALLLLLPFLVPLSLSKGRVTISGVGRLNYSWQVTGYGVEGYKEEAFPAPSGIPHPIRHLSDKPRVIGFQDHLTGTTPIHFDPIWWCEGYPSFPNWPRQWMVLRQNIPEVLSQFWESPAVWFALVMYPFAFRRVWKRFAGYWYLWLPPACMIAAYCFVFILSRYTCAPFSLLGFTLIAVAWDVRPPRWASRYALAILVGLSCYSLWNELNGVWACVQEFRGLKRADDSHILDAYQRMKHEGFQPGDRAGVIGLTLGAQYLQLLEGQEVAAVPARIYHLDDEWGRPLEFAWDKPDEFWKADAQGRERVFTAMRSAGAKWVFASQVPGWANVEGWTPITREYDLRYDSNKQVLFFRRL